MNAKPHAASAASSLAAPPLIALLLLLLLLLLAAGAQAAFAQDSFRDPLLQPGRSTQPVPPQRAAPQPRSGSFEPQQQPLQPPSEGRFDSSAPMQAQSQSPRGFTMSPDAASAGVAADDLGETQDFGIAPTSSLRPTAQLHAPTPTSIPGGRVIGTRELAQRLQQQGRPNDVLLLHAIASAQHLPGAIPVVPASQGGSFDDRVQREFGRYLEQATGGDHSRMLVFYCAGVQC